MCGINGFNWEDKILAKRMATAIKHRGPDAQGVFFDNGVSLGHRRLTILDLSKRSNQPMSNKEGTVWITYNGEIYNFWDIRKELEERGRSFTTTSDTEVIIAAYEEYGHDFLGKLNGMFAMGIWDGKKKELFVARDRLGIKPLFYFYDGKRFAFASEIKALLEADVSRTVNKRELSYYFSLGYIPSRKSIFENTFKLLPGTYGVVKGGKLTIKKYWEIDFKQKKSRAHDEVRKSLLKHLEDSVERRLLADVPVGAFLSGGIDSSSVVAMMRKHTDKLKTFSVGFDHPEFDESRFAQVVSQKFGTDHHSLNFGAEDILKEIDKITFHVDEPLANTSMIANYLVSRLAKKHVKVVLTGEGGDESFAGYDRYMFFKKITANKLPSPLVKVIRPIVQRLGDSDLMRRGRIFLEYQGLKDYEAYAKSWSNTGLNQLGVVIADTVDVRPLFTRSFTGGDVIDSALHWDLRNYLVFDILAQADLTTMAHGLEGRVPYLDHTFIEFSGTVPSTLKLRDTTKFILKDSLRGVLPNEIIFRKKRGFDTPLEHYFRRELKEYVHDAVFSENIKSTGLFDMKALQRVYESHMRGANYRQALFSLMIMNSWIENWEPEFT